MGAFTFREQQIQVENMKQGNSEEAADFLVKVINAVNGLAKDWKGHTSQKRSLTPSSMRYSSMGSRRRSTMCSMLRQSNTLI